MSECSVCLSAIEAGNTTTATALECAHVFHTECIESCIDNDITKCPNCRAEISEEFRKALSPKLRKWEAAYEKRRKFERLQQTRPEDMERVFRELCRTGNWSAYMDAMNSMVDEL